MDEIAIWGTTSRENEDSTGTAAIKHNVVELRGSMKEKFPPSFIIKSANLRLLDPIGQG